MKPFSKEYRGLQVMLNPDWVYVPHAQQTVEHLREVFARARARIEAEKANEAERDAKVRKIA